MPKILTLFLTLFLTLNLLAEEEIPKLTLNGEAVLFKPADQMKLTIGVTNFGKEADAVLKENATKMQRVLKELEQTGLTKDEYQTGQFSINPTYTPYPKNPPPDWQPSINGYEATNTIHIKTEKLNLLGAFIDAAGRAGANKFDDIQAGLKNENTYAAEAILLATKNAIENAKVMANAANVKLLRLLSISLNDSNVRPPQPLARMLYKASAENATTPIEAGQIQIKAQVSVVYEIGN